MKLLDPVWRINNLYKIVDKNGRLVTFRENEHQAMVNRDTSNEKIILKSRQIGFSTGCLIRLFDKSIWTPNQTSVIIAHEQDSIKKLFRIIYRAHKFMDPDIQPALDRGGGSKYEYFFPEINSRIYCDLESRSDTIQNLHVSEFGLMKNDDKVRATIDAVPINGEVTYESTPKGLNHFYDKWNSGTGSKFFFPWYAFKEYQLPCGDIQFTDAEIELVGKALKLYRINITKEQIQFRRWKISQKGGGARGLRAFMEEFPEDDQSCFLSSGENVLDLHLVRELIAKASEPIEDRGWLKVYERLDKTRYYVCGADTAEGVGGDYSVGVMIDTTTRRVVAKIRGHWKPHEFAHRLDEMCKLYTMAGRTPPHLAVERNNHGHAVLLELEQHIQYPNLYQHDDEKIGWRTDSVSRPIMLNAFINAVENAYLKIDDLDVLNECLTLVNNNGKIEAVEGKHDDCIIAAAIGLQLCLKAGNLGVYDDLKGKILL